MYAMPGERKNFLETLQSLDEATKQKVIIVATSIIMVVIVYFWLMYFNNLVAGVGQVAQQPAANSAPAAATTAPTVTVTPAPAAPAAPAGPGIFARIASGFAAMGQWFVNLFRAPRQYIVKP